MRFGVRATGIVIGLVILGASLATADQAPPEMTLPQLIAQALKISPEVKTSQSEVAIAKALKDQAHGYRFPQFDAVIVGAPVPTARQPEIRGNSIFYPDTKNSLHGVTIFGRLDFAMIQPLYTFGKIAHREEAAEKYTEVKQAEVDSKKGEVILQVAQAYYGLVLSQQGESAVQEARDYLNDARERVSKLLALKSASVKDTDTYRINIYEGSIEKFAAEAEEGSKVAYKALQALTGYGPEKEFRVPAALPEPSVSARVPRGALSGPGGKEIADRSCVSRRKGYQPSTLRPPTCVTEVRHAHLCDAGTGGTGGRLTASGSS